MATKVPSKARLRRPVRSASLASVARQAEAERRAVRVPGRRVAVVPLSVLRRLERLAEDASDARLVEEAMAESDERIPYETARRRLGLA